MTEVGVSILYSAETRSSALPKGAIMNGSILVYGNDEMLVTTRFLILEKAGYRVFTAQTFGNAMLVLMNHQIDIVVFCQSLKDEERRGILETARAPAGNQVRGSRLRRARSYAKWGGSYPVSGGTDRTPQCDR
jgi:hypothetical protein